MNDNVSRIIKVNSLLNEASGKKFTKKDIPNAVKLLYKNVDLNIPDDMAIEMIMITMDEFEGIRIDKKMAKDILKAFDKKYTRVTKDFGPEDEY